MMTRRHSRIGQIERNVLVSLLAGRAAVLIPDVYDLTVFDERCEAFAQTIDALATLKDNCSCK